MQAWSRIVLLSLIAAGCELPDAVQQDAETPPDGAEGTVDLAVGDVSQPMQTDAAGNHYDKDGTFQVSTSTATVSNGTRSFAEQIYFPVDSSARPVVVISPGLAQPASGYDSYAHRLASYGVITMVRDDPGPTTPTPNVVDDLTYVVASWLPAQNLDSASPLLGRLDLSRVGLAGHSRGGQASLLATETSLRGAVKAWFGLDPVDSSVLASGAQARGSVGGIGIPLVFLGGSVGSTCSPTADNFQVLYSAATAPAVVIVGIGAGHTQFEDPAGCVACGLCTPQGTAQSTTVLDYSVRYLTAFFARELLGDQTVGPTFDGVGAGADIAAGLITVGSK